MKLPALALIPAAALAIGPALASPQEITVDAGGAVGTLALVLGAHTANAALASGTEVDSYTFDAVAGDRIRFALVTQTVNLDPLVRLRDATGTVVRTVDCAASPVSGCSLSFDQTLATGGRYTINVSDNGIDNAGSYQLHLDRYPPVNNWAGLRYSTPLTESLGHPTDMDFYAFRGVAGSTVNVSLQTLTVNLDPRLEVWAPDGTRVAFTGCQASSVSGCSVGVELALATNGIYRVGTNDQEFDNLGNYRLEVSCVFGNCPLASDPAPIPGVPEPASWWMALAGGALLALRRRRP